MNEKRTSNLLQYDSAAPECTVARRNDFHEVQAQSWFDCGACLENGPNH